MQESEDRDAETNVRRRREGAPVLLRSQEHLLRALKCDRGTMSSWWLSHVICTLAF